MTDMPDEIWLYEGAPRGVKDWFILNPDLKAKDEFGTKYIRADIENIPAPKGASLVIRSGITTDGQQVKILSEEFYNELDAQSDDAMCWQEFKHRVQYDKDQIYGHLKKAFEIMIKQIESEVQDA